MDYRVRVIGDDDLPATQEWALHEHGGVVTALVKESAFGPRVVAEMRVAYRRLNRGRIPAQPGPRLLRPA